MVFNNLVIFKIIDIIKNDKFYGYILEYKIGKIIEEMFFRDNYMFICVEIYKVVIKIIEIIKYLYERNIVYRDIRVLNIIINGEDVYFIDFGFVRIINNERYFFNVDFLYLGYLLLYLYYFFFEKINKKLSFWYDEFDLIMSELKFLKKLLGLNDEYNSIYDLERDFIELKILLNN